MMVQKYVTGELGTLEDERQGYLSSLPRALTSMGVNEDLIVTPDECNNSTMGNVPVLISADRNVELRLSCDGELKIIVADRSKRVLWTSGEDLLCPDKGGAFIKLHGSGDFKVNCDGEHGKAGWRSETASEECGTSLAGQVQLHNNGELHVTDRTGAILWNSMSSELTSKGGHVPAVALEAYNNGQGENFCKLRKAAQLAAEKEKDKQPKVFACVITLWDDAEGKGDILQSASTSAIYDKTTGGTHIKTNPHAADNVASITLSSGCERAEIWDEDDCKLNHEDNDIFTEPGIHELEEDLVNDVCGFDISAKDISDPKNKGSGPP